MPRGRLAAWSALHAGACRQGERWGRCRARQGRRRGRAWSDMVSASSMAAAMSVMFQGLTRMAPAPSDCAAPANSLRMSTPARPHARPVASPGAWPCFEWPRPCPRGSSQLGAQANKGTCDRLAEMSS